VYFSFRSVKELKQHVVNLEKEYDSLNEDMAAGENSGYDETWAPYISSQQ